jgi:hypothetical protein
VRRKQQLRSLAQLKKRQKQFERIVVERGMRKEGKEGNEGDNRCTCFLTYLMGFNK